MCKVNTADPFVLPPFAKSIFVVKQGQFFDYVIHDEVNIDSRFISNVLLESLAELADLRNIKSLIRV